MSNFYGATGLIGGTAGDLDNIDGTNLATGDGAFVITSTAIYVYYMNATSGASESSPDIITPDANSGNKRWLLLDIIGEDAIFELLKLYDTDKTHTLSLKWNEDDSGDRIVNLKVNSANRTIDLTGDLTLDAALTIGDPSANECNLAAASNADIDTGTETVDSFADTLGEGAVWFYVITDNDDSTNCRSGQIMAAWDATNDTIEYTESSTLDVGTVDVTMAVDIDSNNIRLRATAGSDNWTVRCQRMVL